ncbi:MAG: hypothetical protein ACYSWQ_23600, partial [Planctomycetota bacterium]
QAQGAHDPNGTQEPAVTIALTKLDVNDTELKLSWKIKNNTDHEVWICDSLSRTSPSIFEQFTDEDARTLVMRRRYGLPVRNVPGGERNNPASRYVRLLARQEKAESISIALPVTRVRHFPGEYGNAEYAERLVLEIGFYDESLPGLIIDIVELARHLNIDLGVDYYGFSEDVRYRFFGGSIIALHFNSDFGFGPNVRSADTGGEMWMPHFYKVRMGEKVLRIEVDNVSIPYESHYPPLLSHEAKSTESQQSQNANGSGKNKPAREKG